MDSSGTGFIVSPYLVSVPDSVVDAWATQREVLAGRGMFYDLMATRLVVTSREDKLRLERLRGHPEEVAAFAAVAPGPFQLLTQRQVLLPEEDAFRRHRYTCVEIEINRHCNFRCSFCPVEAAPKPKAFMSPELFSLVLDRVREYGAPSISLNHYSEPTLDPMLIERVRLAKEYGLQVRLHTNGSLLTVEKIRALAELGNVILVINLPSVERAEYERVTGTKLFDRVLANLRAIHEHGLPARLSVNSPRESSDENVRRINEMFAAMFGDSVAWPTDNRAGLLKKDEYAADVQHLGRLSGCTYALNQINVAHDGKVFLCCQDFDQKYVLGDLQRMSLRQVAESDRMAQLRRWIFGHETPPEGFICSQCSWTSSLETGSAPLNVGADVRRTQRLPGNASPAMPPWPVAWAVGAPEQGLAAG
ncbi:radical SAM/SPASM domain-containing protein [Corallococcus silvisoli]|uniref:radical SAM/SPASM domain-containing protein n=1 Tax=Corallococcus silvisoli TaxID=2697031 RepID=UPI00137904D0|nr:radical SAM/SPASM domain-containing protein [Corallococcus silvisoli]NBD12969.1 radical SAM protein [Corallococcus silvisoli]